MAWQFDRPDLGRGVAQAFRRAESIYEAAQVKLRGLEATARYRLTNLDQPEAAQEISGANLMKDGVRLTIPEQPGAVVLTYQRVEAGQ